MRLRKLPLCGNETDQESKTLKRPYFSGLSELQAALWNHELIKPKLSKAQVKQRKTENFKNERFAVQVVRRKKLHF